MIPATATATEPNPLPSEPLARYRALRDPLTFLSTCVYTRDQVDAVTPIKPAPVHRPYIAPLVRIWQQEPLLIVFKSRRMWITWLMLALYLHDAITHTERDIYIVSKKEEDADDLVRRAKFIFDHIPPHIWPPDLLPEPYYKQNHLAFPNIGSGLHAVASGADQLRQHTASGILCDEFGFWEKSRETYTSAKPTLDGGGRVTIVSTPPMQISTAPSFFYRLVTDTLDEVA